MLIELVGRPKIPGQLDRTVSSKMETIWLQRPSSDIPWGFRLQGGKEFDQPLSVHRVTPGSVASNGLSQGDVVLKIGNVNAAGISHVDAQEVIKGASNILQLTIKKGSTVSAPVSPTSGYQYQQQQPGYNYQNDDQDKYSTMPDYRVGGGYNGYSNNNNQSGYNNAPENSPYDMRQFQQPPITGYSTLPARGGAKQNTESFRPVQQQAATQQKKYPFKSTSGITLQMTPQSQPQTPPREEYPPSSYSHPMSPVQYENRSDSPYMRQSSGGSGRSEPTNSYPQSYYKKPTPFSPTYSNGNDNIPSSQPQRVQRQQSSGQYNDNRYDSTVSQQDYQAPMYSPRNDEAPPPPPPPVNYRQPEQYGRPSYDQEVPYQRQSSQPSYQSSPYSQHQPSHPDQYDQYNNTPNQGMYVDTQQQPQYQRQGSRPYEQSNVPPEPYQRQHSLQRQPSYGSQQPSAPQQYSTPYSQTPQSYSRQTSRDQVPQSPYNQPQVSSPSHSGTGINSFDEILSPFEKFQNSNYCDKLFARSPDNRMDDSGVMSDMSYGMSDTPRSNQSSNLSDYSPPVPSYQGGYDNRVSGQQSLLRPIHPSVPPPPAVTPPPPPPPPPPSDWAPPQRKLPARQGPPDIGGQQQMPDKVLNTMLKNKGTQKPFSYVPSGTDLKEFKEKARQRRQPRSVMPRGYQGPDLDVDDSPAEPQQATNSKTKQAGPNAPDTGMYKHAQYNSPLRMYSDNNARDALNVQSGGNVDVVGVNNTPERRPSDIKESEVYKMIKVADAQGKHSHVTDLEIEAEKSHDEEAVSAPPGGRGHGLSFRVLQWMTDTAEDEISDDNTPESYKPKKARNPLLRHNSEDDEMRFSGLHTKADIPSKAFQRLNKIALNDADYADEDAQKSNEQNNGNDEFERVGNYDEASIRYRGNYIPSPSFRLLQSLAKTEENMAKSESPVSRTDDEDDGLPDKLSEEDMMDKRYTGAHLPSKAFKALQKSIDTKPETANQSDGVDGSSKIKVLSRAPKVLPKPADRPITPVKMQMRQQRVESPSTDF